MVARSDSFARVRGEFMITCWEIGSELVRRTFRSGRRSNSTPEVRPRPPVLPRHRERLGARHPAAGQAAADQVANLPQRHRQRRRVIRPRGLDVGEHPEAPLDRGAVALRPRSIAFSAPARGRTAAEHLLGQRAMQAVEIVAQRGARERLPAVSPWQVEDPVAQPVQLEPSAELEVRLASRRSAPGRLRRPPRRCRMSRAAPACPRHVAQARPAHPPRSSSSAWASKFSRSDPSSTPGSAAASSRAPRRSIAIGGRC